MNDTINKQIKLSISTEKAFEGFVTQFNEWWPKEYTWSKDTLKKIFITPQVGGFCTEIGPNDFRIDWGTVTNIQKNKVISFKWQIGLMRDPIPNPEKASLINVTFNSISDSETNIELTHSDFKNHGDNYLEYLKALDSDQGWDYILECYKKFAIK